MSEVTNIEWAMHTGGPYLGCTPVSPGCGNCYAWELALMRLFPIFRRAYKAAGFIDWETRPVWGDKATRVLSKGFWNDAVRINNKHAREGAQGRWFPSLIDWLDTMPAGIIDQEGNKLDPIEVLARFLKLIHGTPNLDWLLLTKRPENFEPRVREVLDLCNLPAPDAFYLWLRAWLKGQPPANVWLGVSVEDQKRADERIPLLLQIPAKVRFLSVEPLLEKIELIAALGWNGEHEAKGLPEPLASGIRSFKDIPGVDWVIVGGESGAHRRDCGVEAICDVARQCQAARVPCFVKQDSAFKPGQQGRLPADVWALKQFPAAGPE